MFAWLGALLIAGAWLAGCGAVSPQAPKLEAERVSAATSGIAAACGETYQHEGAGTRARRLRGAGGPGLRAAARQRARELADVFQRDPGWHYQDETLLQIVALSIRYLRDCGLTQAADYLQRATAEHPRRTA